MMNKDTAWLYLLSAGLMEIIWILFLKKSDGFSRLGPSLIVLAIMAVSFYCLSQALKGLPIGLAYAVWTGIGAAGAAVFGILLFGEAFNVLKLVCLAMIVTGVFGLKFIK